MRFITLLVAMLVAASSLSAEYVLVPIGARDVPGAAGSLWRSSLAVTNHSDHDVYVAGIEICFLNPCADTSVSAKHTRFAETFPFWVWVDAQELESIGLVLRVQDMSRQAQTWGTTIPTVPESEALASHQIASLADIPVTPEFRSLLRIYDFDNDHLGGPKPIRKVRVRYYSISAPVQGKRSFDTFLNEAVYDLVPDASGLPPWEIPRMATIPLWAVEALSGSARIRVEVEAVSEDLRFWAFVSVTNNETQHVTIISP